jgi:hypothetical protein
MSRCTLRNIFTILLYVGVGVFLFPYLTGHLGHALIYLLIGIGVAVVCGILRCLFMEGDCTQETMIDAKVESPIPDRTPHSQPGAQHVSR